MLKNYLKIALRNILKHKGYSFINITGLAIGMTCTILILLWVQDELSFNMFHKNVNEIYRVNKEYQLATGKSYNPSTPYLLASEAKEKFPEIANATRLFRYGGTVTYKKTNFNEDRICITDPGFFQIFSFPFVKGDAARALSDPHSIIITEEMALKYFGMEEPVGRTLVLNNSKSFTVSGVIKNIPANSDIKYDFFIPSDSFIQESNRFTNWKNHFFSTFLLLQKDTGVEMIEKKLSGLIREHLPDEKIGLKLQALDRLHLYSLNGIDEGIRTVYLFSIIAFFILIIASINFMNLSTARSMKRSREIGLRKVVGAGRGQIIKQFFGESILMAVLASIITIFLVQLILPPFNNLSNKHLSIDYSNFKLILQLLGIAVFTGLLSGIYPALFLSSFKPVKVLKGTLYTCSKHSLSRKILVILQFSLSITLLICTGIIYSQLAYIKTMDMGYDKENVLYLRMNKEVSKNYEAFKNNLLQNPNITSITRTSELPTTIWAVTRGVKWEGKESSEGAAFGLAAVDYDYLQTLKMEIAAGRGFSREFSTENPGVVVNEAAVRAMGMKSPIGKQLYLGNQDFKIIGVVKDFIFLPLTWEMEPMILNIDPNRYHYIILRIEENSTRIAINHLEKTYLKFAPGFPFEFSFLDEQFDRIYRDEHRTGQIFGYFTLLGIFISCMGLFGLASFLAEQRTREIGIRKVLGASVLGVVVLFLKEFSKWIALSNLIAWPAAYIAMNKWLQNFAYRTNIRIETFIFSGLLALVIALSTVSYQSIKSANANPVEALKYE